MYAMYVLGFMLMLFMFVGGDDEQKLAAESKIESRVAQMLTYHEYAEDFCKMPGNCAAASEVTSAQVTSIMPSMMSGSVAYTDDRFRSFTDGSGLVWTISRDHNFDAAAFDMTVLGNTKMVKERSEIAAKLATRAGQYRPAGRYNRAAGTLTSYNGEVVSIPGALAGVTFQDDVPMVAEY